MVLSRNPVTAAMFMILSLVGVASLFVLLEAFFLAVLQVLVYAGAVMVLFLFVIMMLDIDVAKMRAGFTNYLPLGLLVAILMAGELVLVMLSKDFGSKSLPRPAGQGTDYSNTKALGELVYTEYVFVFELAAIILLVAIIAAISLTLRRRPTTRYQAPERQVKVQKADRVRMVTLPRRPEDEQ